MGFVSFLSPKVYNIRDMRQDLNDLKEQWINQQAKRFPKPRKPKPRVEEVTRMQFKYDVPTEWADEFDEYVTDAVQMFIDHKIQ